MDVGHDSVCRLQATDDGSLEVIERVGISDKRRIALFTGEFHN
jgi:hypothetical protein